MKFTVPLYAITEAVKAVSGFCGTATESKEYQCILFEDLDADAITLFASNRSCSIKVPIVGVSIERGGQALVPAAELRRWLTASSGNSPLTFDVHFPEVSLATGKSRCKIPVLEPKSYPKLDRPPSDEKVSAMVPGGEFIRAIQSVIFAIEKRENKTGRTDVVLFDMMDDMVTSSISFMATDHKAMSVVTLPAKVVGDSRAEMVPSGNLNLLLPMIEGGGDARITLTRNECIIETERVEFRSQIIMSKTLPWRKVLKAWDLDLETKLSLPPKEFLAAVRQVVAVDPEDHRMHIETIPGAVTLSTRKGTATIEVPVSPLEVKALVDYEYMIDFFNAAVRRGCEVLVEPGQARSNALIFRAGGDWKYSCVQLIDTGDAK